MQRLVLSFLIVMLVWAVGLAAFITSLPNGAVGAPEKTDGVAVYTGGGGARIMAGMIAFSEGGAERMLISGVHRGTSRARLSEFWDGDSAKFDCCVDIGHEARTTIGNAVETADWVSGLNYRTVLLVTSDYHMPRAITATKAQMPDVKIIPYPVASGHLDQKGRPQSRQAWRILAGEYSKYIVARVRVFFSSLGL